MHRTPSALRQRIGATVGVVAAGLAVIAAPAAASDRAASDTFKAGDNYRYNPPHPLGGAMFDLVASSFRYDDAGRLQVSATMAGDIDISGPDDRSKPALNLTWNFFAPTSKGRCENSPRTEKLSVNGSAFPGQTPFATADFGPRGATIMGTSRVDGRTFTFDASAAALAHKDLGCALVGVDKQFRGAGFPYDIVLLAAPGLDVQLPTYYEKTEAIQRDGGIEVTGSGAVRLRIGTSPQELTGTVKLTRKGTSLGKDSISITRLRGLRDTVTIRLSKAVRRLLSSKGKLKAQLTYVVKDDHGHKDTSHEDIVLIAPID